MKKIDFKKDNYLFLIGNGINMAMGNPDCQWEDVLYRITPDELKGELFEENTSSHRKKFTPLLSLTETVNAIQLHSSAENYEVARALAEHIGDFKFEKRKSTLLSFVKTNGIDVLTTNFDMNIEHWLCEDKNQSCKIGAGTYYWCWDKYFSAPGSDAKVWHVHGSIDKYRSILFSMTRYMRAAGHATKIMNDESNDYADLKKTWLWQFLSRPLVIVGWRCAKEETLLRWLLIERLMSRRRFGIGELPPSYYLYRKKSDIRENKDFLKFVKIEPVSFGKDIFNSRRWDKQSSAIELPEVK